LVFLGLIIRELSRFLGQFSNDGGLERVLEVFEVFERCRGIAYNGFGFMMVAEDE
jgi:hypothetical protein